MRKIAVIVEGTAAHECGVCVVTAANEIDALNKVADREIRLNSEYSPELGICTKTEAKNYSSPTYEMEVLNDEGNLVTSLRTANDVVILD